MPMLMLTLLPVLMLSFSLTLMLTLSGGKLHLRFVKTGEQRAADVLKAKKQTNALSLEAHAARPGHSEDQIQEAHERLMLERAKEWLPKKRMERTQGAVFILMFAGEEGRWRIYPPPRAVEDLPPAEDN